MSGMPGCSQTLLLFHLAPVQQPPTPAKALALSRHFGCLVLEQGPRPCCWGLLRVWVLQHLLLGCCCSPAANGQISRLLQSLHKRNPGSLHPYNLTTLLTLLTCDTTQSSTSPLKGLNVIHWKVALNVAKPLPSWRILPCRTTYGYCTES